MSEELKDIEDIEEVQLQDEDLVEDVEVETEESIAEDAEVDVEETTEEIQEEADEAEAEVEEVVEAKLTKAGMINAMYKHMSKMNKDNLSAAYDAMMKGDEEDEDDEEEMKESKGKVKESYDFKADLDALVSNDESLTEEFQSKAATIFEAAVKSKITEEIDRLEEEYNVSLEEETATIKNDLVEKVDGYLNYVVEGWMAENQIAIENGLRMEIAESFMTALKGVFVEHYIEVPESKVDMVDDLVDQVSELEEQLNSATEDNIRLTESVHRFQRSEIIAEASKDLAATEVEKLKGLIENVDFEDAETFAKKINTIKESYFAKPVVNHTEETELASEEDEIQLSASMANYASVLSQTLKKK